MAKELLVSAATGLNIYAIGRVLNGTNIGLWGNVQDGALEVYDGDRFSRYDIEMLELGASGFYEADFPEVFFPERAIEIIFYQRIGDVAAQSDTKLSGSLYEQQDDWVATQALTV